MIREQHEFDIEAIREQHRLEIIAKEKDFEREKEMMQLKHEHSLELIKKVW